MTVIRFAVQGLPIAQGSFIGRLIKGRAYAVMSNATEVKRWRKAIHDRAVDRLETPYIGPVVTILSFRLPYPASYPKRRRELPWKQGSKDIDKLCRAVLDALKDTILTDDAQVVGLLAVKDYVTGDDEPGVWIEVRPLEDGDEGAAWAWPAAWLDLLKASGSRS